MNKQDRMRLINAENKLVVVRRGGSETMGKTGERV